MAVSRMRSENFSASFSTVVCILFICSYMYVYLFVYLYMPPEMVNKDEYIKIRKIALIIYYIGRVWSLWTCYGRDTTFYRTYF